MSLTATNVRFGRTLWQTFRHIARGRVGYEAVRLALRLVGARSMSVISLVVALWLVDVHAFATFGVFQTVASLAAMALFLRFDAAIISARTQEEAGLALRLCLALGAPLWLLFSMLAIACGTAGLVPETLASLLPLSILMRGLLRLAFGRMNRDGDFKALGRASLIQSICQPLVLLVAALASPDDAVAFAVADIAGHASGVAYLAWRGRHHAGEVKRGWSLSDFRELAVQRKTLPLYNLPSSFLSLAFVMSPLLIMPLTGQAALAGHAALAYRIFDVPSQIVAATASPIFLHWLRPTDERAGALFGRRLMLVFVLPVGLGFLAMAAALLVADPYLAGTKFAGLESVLPAIAAFQLFLALGGPLNDACVLFPQQRRLVAIQVLALAGSAVAAVLALAGEPFPALAVLVVAAGVRTVALGELLRKLSVLTRQLAGAVL
ncbi:oligosaccharide flippase family protein [Microvirga rosea]|uniref:oligosaccharide flippase family protein n=1 Tax=Microvirga rosea TaxID=2715425 RepID=UPI001D0A7020|nr:oligosaccharide flippase family protein [Microvirga rosea]